MIENDSADDEGGANAHRITGSGGAPHNVSQIVTLAAGVTYTYSLRVKPGNTNRVLLGFYDGGYQDHIFDMASGAWVFQAAGSTVHATQLANGWWRIAVTRTCTQSGYSPQGMWFGPINNNGTVWNHVGNGNYIFARRAQVERGDAPGPYQNVDDFGVYPIPTTGKPAFLFMRTWGPETTWVRSQAAIDFSSNILTAAMAVQGHPPQGAGFGFFLSNQNSPFSNGNNFALLTGEGAPWGDLSMAFRGSSVNNTNGYRGTRVTGGNRRSVIVAQARQSPSFTSFRHNGITVDSGTTDIGAGGFGNKQVDIGREFSAGANGEFFASEIIAIGGSALTQTEIALLEEFLANRIDLLL